jgi:hypothetical protein
MSQHSEKPKIAINNKKDSGVATYQIQNLYHKNSN